MTSKKRKYGNLSERPLPTEDASLVDDVFAAFTRRPSTVSPATQDKLPQDHLVTSPTNSQPPQSSQLSELPPGSSESWQPPQSSQLSESSQPLQDPQISIDLMASLPEMAGRLELPHQLTDHLFRHLDPMEEKVFIQLYRLSWGFGKSSCRISNPKLSERTGMPESTLKKTLQRLKEKGLVKKIGGEIGYGKDQGIEFWVSAPSSQLSRSRQLAESRQPPQAHNNRKALKEINKREIAALDFKNCPDCHGTGMWYPEGYEKGAAKCKHTKITETY